MSLPLLLVDASVVERRATLESVLSLHDLDIFHSSDQTYSALDATRVA